nr:MAG TPA: hypothetical protein [Caudoviricetes sp.]
MSFAKYGEKISRRNAAKPRRSRTTALRGYCEVLRGRRNEG